MIAAVLHKLKVKKIMPKFQFVLKLKYIKL